MLIKQQLNCFFKYLLVKKQEKKSFLKDRISGEYGVLVKNHQGAMLDILTSYEEGVTETLRG